MDWLDSVAETAAVLARRIGEPVVQSLASTYFDTGDRRLSSRGVVFRVRRDGFAHTQTLKTGTGLTRNEWEWSVPDLTPDMTVVTEAAARAVIADLKPGDLEPMFETRIERTLHLLGEGASDHGVIELAVDRGAILGLDGQQQPISEIELELKAGTSADLYRLALELADTVPLRVEARTKAARGFALGRSEPPRPVKARRLALTPGLSVDSAMATIFDTCFHQFTANESCVLAGHDPEGVHQARVALRRLRVAISLFRDFIPAADHAWVVGELRWLGQSFGPARDWDVFRTELLAPLMTALGNHPDLAADLAALDGAALERREAAYRAVRAALESSRFTRFQLGFDLWLESRGWLNQPVTATSALLFRPLFETAQTLLESKHRKARKAGAHFAHLDTSHRHRVRITLKTLRYAVDFFRSLYDEKPVTRFLQRLGALQETLGHLNDVATATRLAPLLAQTETGSDTHARAAGVVIGWHSRGLVEDEPDLIAQWGEFRAGKPFWARAQKSDRHHGTTPEPRSGA